MQPITVLFAIFVLSFVAAIGWYAGRGVVQFVAEAVARGGAKHGTRRVELTGQGEKNTLGVLD
jgi:hypothetical protein